LVEVEVAAEFDGQQRSEAISFNSPLDFIPGLTDLLSDSEEEAETDFIEQSVGLAFMPKPADSHSDDNKVTN
jgi:hypothetical protein